MEKTDSQEPQIPPTELDTISAITRPTPAGPNYVHVLNPAMTMGTLCLAYGPVGIPSGYVLEGVFVKVIQALPPFPPSSAIYPTGYERKDTVCAGGVWNLNKQLKAFANSTTPPATSNNTICVVTVSNKLVSPWPPTYRKNIDQTNLSFRAIQGACPVKLLDQVETDFSKSQGVDSSELRSASLFEGLDFVEPIDRVKDWLLYRIVNVVRSPEGSASVADAGPVLMLQGAPLRARVAAFAAGNVCWRHSLETPEGTVWSGGVVRRAIGDLIPADENFLFHCAPQNSIVVSQPSRVPPFATKVNVLASESRSSPDYFHLDPEEVVRVQVNFDLRENVRSGQFDLWVKVIDD